MSKKKVYMTTRDIITKSKIKKEMGLISASTTRTNHIGKDLWARYRSLFGGEISTYSDLLTQATQESSERLYQMAEIMGANAILKVRFENSTTADPLTGITVYSVCYGTACVVDFEDDIIEQK